MHCNNRHFQNYLVREYFRELIMFSSKEQDAGDTAFFKRNPRRSRDDDEKEESKSNQNAVDSNDRVGDSTGFDDKETSNTTRPGRRRPLNEPDDDKQQSNAGNWTTSPEKRAQNTKLLIEQNDINEERQNSKKDRDMYFNDADQDNDILVIPDLDEDGADADHRVAHAPRNVQRKVPSLVDLESEVASTAAFVEGGYDLTILMRTLVPHALVQEEDVQWTFDGLMRELTDELTNAPKTVLHTTISGVIQRNSAESGQHADAASAKNGHDEE